MGHVAGGWRGVLRSVHIGDDGDLGRGRDEGEKIVREGIEPRPMPAHRGMRKPSVVLRERSQKRVDVKGRAAAQEKEKKIRV